MTLRDAKAMSAAEPTGSGMLSQPGNLPRRARLR